MIISETILGDFISDFKLDIPGKGVCFKADIEFKTPSLFKKFNCEVQIINMTQKEVIILYLLNPQLAEFGIPDTFSFDPDNFFYTKNMSLTIADHDLLRGKYILEICPLKEKPAAATGSVALPTAEIK